MKRNLFTFSLLAALAFALPLPAADDDHARKQAGPNGGRLITSLEPHAEFLVTADRKVQITFIDEHGQPVTPAGQVVTVTAGDRAAPTRLSFTRAGNVLISKGALPAGNGFPAVVQIKPSPDAKMVTERFNINLSTCPECQLGEYACICDH